MNDLTQWLLTPPLAFIIYVFLAWVMFEIGRRLSADVSHESPEKSSVYASGERPPTTTAAPGYKNFFVIAFFFAILHLGALVAGSGFAQPEVLLYLFGLLFALIVLTLR